MVPVEVRERVHREGRARVIVELALPIGPHVPEGLLSPAAVSGQRSEIGAVRNQLLARLVAHHHRVHHRYETVPLVALEVGPDALTELEASAFWVKRVVEDKVHAPSLPQSVPLIGADQAWSRGLDGTGMVVAVLDTGVQGTHPFLSGKVVEEACYSSTVRDPRTGRDQSITLCPNGSTQQIGPGAGVNCSLGGCWHGTHVAGIAAGNGTAAGVTFSGVAKGAQVMAVQIFSQFTGSADCGGSPPCVLAWDSDIIAGLERVYAVSSVRSIASVNLSLGGGLFTTTCDTQPEKPIIDNLRSVGIATVIAAGNNGVTNAVSSPGCISSAISVGATTKADGIASFTNAAPFMSLFAPGVSIYSSVVGGGFGYASGTSMATPHVTGAWAVLKQAAPAATVDQILFALQTTGVPITDTRSGGSVTKPRIQVSQALAVLAPSPTVSSVVPSQGAQGAVVPVTINGSGFANGAAVSVGAGITVTGVTLASTSQLTATLTISSGATVGTRDVTVTNPGGGSGTRTNGFTVTAGTPRQQRVNVAAQANGGVASASSSYSGISGFYPAAGANDGDRKGLNWGSGGGWNDATPDVFPDWLQVTFNGSKTISEIDVFTVQDNYAAPVEPTPEMTFSSYGITDFQVQYWTGAAWTTVPGGGVTGNNKVWRQFIFPAVTTDRIRVLITGALASYSRLTEVEAWGN